MNIASAARAGLISATICAALVTGCSSSGGSSSSSPSVAAVCTDYQALQDSLSALVNVDVIASGTDGLKSAVADVQEKTTALAASSKQFAPQVDALKTAVSQLASTLGNLSGGGLRAAATTIASQLTAIRQAAQGLASAVSTACPSATSS